jgi:hypothetical protein
MVMGYRECYAIMSMQSLVKAEREVTTKWRERIQGSQMLNRLIAHCEGKLDLSMSQCNTSLRLIDKILPSLQAVSVDVQVNHSGMGRFELEARLLALGQDPKLVWSKLSGHTIDHEASQVKSTNQVDDHLSGKSLIKSDIVEKGTTPASDESESSS